MIFPQKELIAAIIVALVAFYSGWSAQGWHRDSLEKDRVESILESERLAAKTITANETRVIQAQSDATTRESRARNDATNARTELGRLRSLSDAAIESSRISHQACVDRATAIGYVFQQCAERYSELGEKATRHASDAQTLSEAWPQAKQQE